MSRTLVITPPPRILTVEDAKAHLRVGDDAEDGLIEAFIDAAQGHIDGPAGWLGRSLGTQTLELRLCGFSTWLELPYGPVLSALNIKFDDPYGAEQTLDPALYVEHGGVIVRAANASWPAVRSGLESVRVRYEAGYADGEVPAPIVAAVKLMVGDLFENRASVAPGARPAVNMSVTVERLLGLYKVWRV